MGDATLVVNSEEHKGWTEVSVTRSLEQLAHSFELSFVDQWSPKDEAIAIRAGDVCTLKLGKSAVTEGFVTDGQIDYDANDYTMRVAGMSRTADLVDCSAVYKKGQWRDRDLEQIANDLCAPFSITVKVNTDLGASFKWFALQDGETVHEALERACRQRGVLMTTSAKGELVFERIGSLRALTAIERGVNVVKGGRSESWKERFSRYTVKAQAPGDDDFHGATAAQGKVVVTDDVVTRYRPLIVQTECQSAGTLLTKRANWERNVRAGRSQRLTYTLDGWDADGVLWAPNMIVPVKDDSLQVDGEFLIVTVKQAKNLTDEWTEVELCNPVAMTVEPLTKQPKTTKSKFITTSQP